MFLIKAIINQKDGKQIICKHKYSTNKQAENAAFAIRSLTQMPMPSPLSGDDVEISIKRIG